MWELDNRGEEELWHAAKLMETIILYCSGRLDDVILKGSNFEALHSTFTVHSCVCWPRRYASAQT